MKAVCDWCDTLLEIKGCYDPMQHELFCCKSCEEAEYIFRAWQSDEEINRRTHYKELTKGKE